MKITLLLFGVLALPLLAQERMPGPACAPFLNGERYQWGWNDPANEGRAADCLVEIQTKNYKTAKQVWKMIETIRKDTDPFAKATAAAMKDYTLDSAIKAEFGKACEAFEYIREPDDTGELPLNTLFTAVDRGACLADIGALHHPKEGECLILYLNALADAGTIPASVEETFSKEEYVPYVEAAIRDAFGYNPPKVLHSALKHYVMPTTPEPLSESAVTVSNPGSAPLPALSATDGGASQTPAGSAFSRVVAGVINLVAILLATTIVLLLARPLVFLIGGLRRLIAERLGRFVMVTPVGDSADVQTAAVPVVAEKGSPSSIPNAPRFVVPVTPAPKAAPDMKKVFVQRYYPEQGTFANAELGKRFFETVWPMIDNGVAVAIAVSKALRSRAFSATECEVLTQDWMATLLEAGRS